MKELKKCTIALFLVLFMLATLAGCAQHGVCDECRQIEKLNKYVEKDGEVHWYCDDCYRMAKLFDF